MTKRSKGCGISKVSRTRSRPIATWLSRGQVVEILVDQVEDGVSVGRSYRQAPEIDGVTLLDRGDPGRWVHARVTGGYGTDLVAEVVSTA